MDAILTCSAAKTLLSELEAKNLFPLQAVIVQNTVTFPCAFYKARDQLLRTMILAGGRRLIHVFVVETPADVPEDHFDQLDSVILVVKRAGLAGEVGSPLLYEQAVEDLKILKAWEAEAITDAEDYDSTYLLQAIEELCENSVHLLARGTDPHDVNLQIMEMVESDLAIYREWTRRGGGGEDEDAQPELVEGDEITGGLEGPEEHYEPPALAPDSARDKRQKVATETVVVDTNLSDVELALSNLQDPLTNFVTSAAGFVGLRVKDVFEKVPPTQANGVTNQALIRYYQYLTAPMKAAMWSTQGWIERLTKGRLGLQQVIDYGNTLRQGSEKLEVSIFMVCANLTGQFLRDHISSVPHRSQPTRFVIDSTLKKSNDLLDELRAYLREAGFSRSGSQLGERAIKLRIDQNAAAQPRRLLF